MRSLTLLEKKFVLLRMNRLVEQLITEGIVTLNQAEEIRRLNAQLIGVKG